MTRSTRPLLMRVLCVLAGLALTSWPAEAHQLMPASAPVALPGPPAFARPDSDECPGTLDVQAVSLGFTLKDEVLEYLARMEESTFVQSYLLSLIAERGNPGNGLAERARRFARADTRQLIRCSDPGAWEVPNVSAMIAALRAEANHQRRLRLAADRIDILAIRKRITGQEGQNRATQLSALRDELEAEWLLYQSTLPSSPPFDSLRQALQDALALSQWLPRWFQASGDLQKDEERLQQLEAERTRLQETLSDLLPEWAESAVDVALADRPAVDSVLALVRLHEDDPRKAAARRAHEGYAELERYRSQVERHHEDRDSLMHLLAVSERIEAALRQTREHARISQGPASRGAAALPDAVADHWRTLQQTTTRYLQAAADLAAAEGARNEAAADVLSVQTEIARVLNEPEPDKIDADGIEIVADTRLDALESAYVHAEKEIYDVLSAGRNAGTLATRLRTVGQPLLSAREAAEPAIEISNPRPLQSPEQALWALTDLLYERAQEEITLAYISRVRDWFDEDDVGRMLVSAFPKTYKLFVSSDLTIFETPRVAWRAALQDDVRHLPLTLIHSSQMRRVLLDRLFRAGDDPVPADHSYATPCRSDSDRIEETEASRAVLGRRRACAETHLDVLDVAVGISERLMQGESPLDTSIHLARELEREQQKPRPLLVRLGLSPAAAMRVTTVAALTADIASDLRMQGGLPPSDVSPAAVPGYLLSVSQFDAAAPRQRKLYVHLLTLNYLHGVLQNIETLPAGLDFYAVEDATRRALRALELAQVQLAMLRTDEAGGTGTGFGNYVAASVHQSTAVLDLVHVLFGPAPALDAETRVLNDVRDRWEDVGGVYAALTEGAYSDALSRTVLLYYDVTGRQMPERLHRLSSLAASVASARTGAEMEAAFRAAALPVGGYRGKRISNDSPLTVNAYPGLGLSTEKLYADAASVGPRWGVVTPSVSLPLGLEWHRPRIPSIPRVWRSFRLPFSVFVAAVDLGAPLSYRIRHTRVKVDEGDGPMNGDVSQTPRLTLRQVLAPGLFLVRGPDHSPFTLGLGAQFYPALREVEPAGDAASELIDPLDALHYGVFVGVDLTLFRF